MDKQLRNEQRAASTGDPEAELRLRYTRCRAGQCCAHVHDIPMPSIESLGVKLFPSAYDPSTGLIDLQTIQRALGQLEE